MWRQGVFVCVPILISRDPYSMNGIERDSPRDQLVVTLFLLTVFGLLLGAGIKSRMVKAGLGADMAESWNAGRRWWEVSTFGALMFFQLTEYFQAWVPRQQELGLSRFGYSADREVRMGEYIPVANTPRAQPPRS